MFDKLGKTLGNLVFEPSADAEAQDQSTQQSENASTTANKSENSSAVPVARTAPSPEQQKMFETMVERLQAQVFARTTVFVQFSNALKSLEPVIPDLSTRYKAAFAMLNTSGVTFDGLLNAIKVHESDLASEVNRFNADSDAQLQRAVTEPSKKIQSLNDAQAADRDTLAVIQERMNARVGEINAIQQEMTAAQNTVTTVANVFKSAEATMSRTLLQEQQNITTYLK